MKRRGRFKLFETFNATLSPMLVMFLCMLIGYAAKKLELVPGDAATVLSKLENYFFVPALIINTFMRYCTVASIMKQYRLIMYCTAALVIALAVALPLSNLFVRNDDYKRNIYKYALTFGNFSFMGNAIVPAILGEAELYHYMLYILPLNIVVYTWGVVILIPKTEKRQNVLKNLINPIFVSIIAGAAIGLFGFTRYVPGFVCTTVGNLAACMGPVAMILTGFVIGEYNFVGLLKDKKVYAATFLRLIVLPLFFVFVLRFLGAGKTTLLLTLFAFGTPLGLNTVVFPSAYGGDTSTGASMAMISHTLCIITIPLMYAMMTHFII